MNVPALLPDLPPSDRGPAYDHVQRLAVSLIVEHRQRLQVREILHQHGTRFLGDLPDEKLPAVAQALEAAVAIARAGESLSFDVPLPVEARKDE